MHDPRPLDAAILTMFNDQAIARLIAEAHAAAADAREAWEEQQDLRPSDDARNATPLHHPFSGASSIVGGYDDATSLRELFEDDAAANGPSSRSATVPLNRSTTLNRSYFARVHNGGGGGGGGGRRAVITPTDESLLREAERVAPLASPIGGGGSAAPSSPNRRAAISSLAAHARSFDAISAALEQQAKALAQLQALGISAAIPAPTTSRVATQPPPRIAAAAAAAATAGSYLNASSDSAGGSGAAATGANTSWVLSRGPATPLLPPSQRSPRMDRTHGDVVAACATTAGSGEGGRQPAPSQRHQAVERTGPSLLASDISLPPSTCEAWWGNNSGRGVASAVSLLVTSADDSHGSFLSLRPPLAAPFTVAATSSTTGNITTSSARGMRPSVRPLVALRDRLQPSAVVAEPIPSTEGKLPSGSFEVTAPHPSSVEMTSGFSEVAIVVGEAGRSVFTPVTTPGRVTAASAAAPVPLEPHASIVDSLTDVTAAFNFTALDTRAPAVAPTAVFSPPDRARAGDNKPPPAGSQLPSVPRVEDTLYTSLTASATPLPTSSRRAENRAAAPVDAAAVLPSTMATPRPPPTVSTTPSPNTSASNGRGPAAVTSTPSPNTTAVNATMLIEHLASTVVTSAPRGYGDRSAALNDTTSGRGGESVRRVPLVMEGRAAGLDASRSSGTDDGSDDIPLPPLSRAEMATLAALLEELLGGVDDDGDSESTASTCSEDGVTPAFEGLEGAGRDIRGAGGEPTASIYTDFKRGRQYRPYQPQQQQMQQQRPSLRPSHQPQPSAASFPTRIPIVVAAAPPTVARSNVTPAPTANTTASVSSSISSTISCTSSVATQTAGEGDGGVGEEGEGAAPSLSSLLSQEAEYVSGSGSTATGEGGTTSTVYPPSVTSPPQPPQPQPRPHYFSTFHEASAFPSARETAGAAAATAWRALSAVSTSLASLSASAIASSSPANSALLLAGAAAATALSRPSGRVAAGESRVRGGGGGGGSAAAWGRGVDASAPNFPPPLSPPGVVVRPHSRFDKRR